MNESLLIQQIHEYRIRNNIPPGDIERDIDNYYCTEYPSACQKEASDYNPALARTSEPAREPMVNRVTRWVTTLISRMPRGGYTLAATTDVNRRGMVCSGCPMNMPWRTGCPGCTSNVSALLLQVRQLRRTPHDAALYGCKVGGWANESAIHMGAAELPLTDGQKADLPVRCWRIGL